MAIFESLLIMGMIGNNPSSIQPSNIFTPVQLQALSEPINGTSRNDTLNGNDADNTINGLEGNDKLNGKAGRDTMNGGPGDDILYGGSGPDILTGGPGRDIFLVRGVPRYTPCPSNIPCQISITSDDGRDIITDFNPREDEIKSNQTPGVNLNCITCLLAQSTHVYGVLILPPDPFIFQPINPELPINKIPDLPISPITPPINKIPDLTLPKITP